MPKSLSPLLEKPLPDSVGPCLFRRVGEAWVVTNEWGQFHRLSEAEFRDYLGGSLAEETPLWHELRSKGFLRRHLDFRVITNRYHHRTAPLRQGGTLHVIALTRRSDQATPYRPADAGLETDMSLATARRVVRFIFECPSSELTIQLRGGEPLLNWDVLEFIVRHARAFSGSVRRRLRIGLVSNLAALDAARMDFLAEHEVELCAPLDGPAALHDLGRRPADGGSAHAATVRAIESWIARHPAASRPEAFATPTRAALGRAEEIIEEYRRLGLSSIRVRPLVPAGLARPGWGASGLSAEEYLGFYQDLLGRVLAGDCAKAPFVERGAAELLCRILTDEDAGMVDSGPVYGGGYRQLAYDSDGGVFLSAEGLDLSHTDGDAFFRLGGVDQPRRAVAAHLTLRAAALASELGSQPLCRQCAYMPYCGVSPVYNYAQQGSLHGRNPTNDRCAILLGRFDALFARLAETKDRAQLERWAQGAAVPMERPLSPFTAGGQL